MKAGGVPEEPNRPEKKTGSADVIAERRLRLDETSKLLIRIERPVFRHRNCWACAYTIVAVDPYGTSKGEPIVNEALGVDSLQALQLVFAAIRTELVQFNGRLSFLDQAGHAIDPVISGLPPALEHHVTSLVESEIARVTALLEDPKTRIQTLAFLRSTRTAH